MMWARLYLGLDRAPRRDVDVAGTVRRDDEHATVRIDNLSTSGFHVTTAMLLQVDEFVTIGIPGIGAHLARVVRRSETGYGCAFTKPIDAGEVERAGAFTVVWQEFTPDRRPIDRAEPPALSSLARLLVLVGLVLAIWSLVALVATLAGTWD